MSGLISREAAQQPSPVAALRRIALETLARCDEGYCLSLKGFLSRCGKPLHPEIVRGVMADLRQDGLVMHCRGLMTEDGEMAGSGWGITPAGEAYLRSLPPAQDAALDLSSVTRVVLVDYTKMEGTFQTTVSGDITASIDVQDAGRTLKIFVNKRGVGA